MLSNTAIHMLQHGHQQEYKIIKPLRKLILVGKKLDKLRAGKIYLKSMELNTALTESEEFMRGHFNLHKIPFLDIENYNESLTKEYDSATEVISDYEKHLKKINPYGLPIVLVEEEHRYAEIAETGLNCQDIEVISKIRIAFWQLLLSNTITNYTPSIITHEITHTQIDSHKGATKSLYNHEIIPIFVQFVENFEKSEDLNEIDEVFRLIDISDLIDSLRKYYKRRVSYTKDELFDLTKYLESTLKAFMLFEIYANSSINKQKDIFADIQKIFNGEMIVEELLEKNKVTLKESSKLLQKKYL